jgi:serine/threonine protein kinase
LALESLQRLGIVHRDIKPANVFLDATGNIVLGDLGLGKKFSLEDRGPEPFHVVFNADPTATSGSFHFDSPTTNERCGTPAFMAPDQHHGRPYSYDVDVWGIGVSFFYMLTGRSPWSGNPKTVDDYARIAGRRPHFKPDDGLDEETQDIIEWMLVPIREARPTVQELKKHTFFSSMQVLCTCLKYCTLN